jgi:hypothetical protein
VQSNRRWLTLVAAFLLLNVSLSFRNIWPTPAIRWHGELSVELAVCVLGLLAARRWLGPPSRGALRGLSALWVIFVLGHYADVTAPALYGREVNLYWDLRNVSAVAEMLGQAAPIWLVVAVLAAAIVVIGFLYAIARWALGRLSEATGDPRERLALAVVAVCALVLFAFEGQQSTNMQAAGFLQFPAPVTETYARQIRLIAKARSAARTNVLPPSPSMNTDMTRINGADVLLLFIESYGAVSYERPELAAQLAPFRADLEAAIHETHRDVVSAFVESPTFGGNSWLAHITLLSGVEVRDRDTNAILMTQKRDTMVSAFSRHGYRTVAMMPGLWQSWPEGVFYGFDEIYSGSRLDYRGPEFGWWDFPDQFTLARMDALEINKGSRPPVFVFFPTVSTHIPFSPVPPYQPDWPRLLTDHPYESADVDRALEKQPDWLKLGPGYADAMTYTYRSLAGYLRMRTDRDFVMILLGDHQPPAAVSGTGAPWDVPVHVIASRPEVLDRLKAHGFREGLTPVRPALGHMPVLVPTLFDAFGDPEQPRVAREP